MRVNDLRALKYVGTTALILHGFDLRRTRECQFVFARTKQHPTVIWYRFEMQQAFEKALGSNSAFDADLLLIILG